MTAEIANSNKYTLNKFREITFNGFDFTIPDESVALINLLASQVGSQTYIKNQVFQKNEHKEGVIFGLSSTQSNFKLGNNKKRRGNKNLETNDDDWETLRTFQATKIEQKNGKNYIHSIYGMGYKFSEK